ncbi:hypothetical protein JCM19235_1333 [Vibrio maritimus]|uniref:Uncharacterized protein n=1 Tax=Vibrio maritimus TaxID=990268 RepID=A0A090SUP0_9VIBR|nr:hypothetical protein JCM19235_1333 [Vibrio maritimus]
MACDEHKDKLEDLILEPFKESKPDGACEHYTEADYQTWLRL